jgi:hypothetical protein
MTLKPKPIKWVVSKVADSPLDPIMCDGCKKEISHDDAKASFSYKDVEKDEYIERRHDKTYCGSCGLK